MAEQSELSEKSITSGDISALFAKFRTEMFDCLMFLNSVSSITLCDIDVRTGKPINKYTVRAHLSDDDTQLRTEFSQFIAHVTAKLKAGAMQVWNVPSKEVTYTLNVSDNQGYHERWLVHQRIGFAEGTVISSALSDAFKRSELSLLPRGGVAALLERRRDTGSSANTASTHARACKAFCFLPLPIKTELPVSINGHFALDHEARRNLWSDEDRSAKTEWNELLLRHVIAPAYVSILEAVPGPLRLAASDGGVGGSNPSWSFMEHGGDDRVVSDGMERYSELFPRLSNTDHYVTTLVKGQYVERLQWKLGEMYISVHSYIYDIFYTKLYEFQLPAIILFTVSIPADVNVLLNTIVSNG